MKNPVRIEDLYELKFLSEPVISPDGRFGAWVVNQADKEKNAYVSSLWIMDLVSGKKGKLRQDACGSLVWLDSETLAFLAGKECRKLSLTGGESEALFSLEEKILAVRPLPEGLFLLHYSHPCQEVPAEEGDVEVFDELPFWKNGKGVTNKMRNGLGIYDPKEKKLCPITDPFVDVLYFDISSDGQQVVYSCREYRDVQAPTSGLRLYSRREGSTRILRGQREAQIDQVKFLGQSFGNKIFYPPKPFDFGGRNPAYMLWDPETGESMKAAFPDAMITNTVGTDSAYGGGALFCVDEDGLYFCNTKRYGSEIFLLPPDGKVRQVTSWDGAILSFDKKGGSFLVNAMRGQKPGELYQLKADSAKTGGWKDQQVTDFHESFLESRAVQAPERFTWVNRDGVELDGYVIPPLNYDPAASYPGILEVHGGPKVSFGSIYHHEMQCLSGKGYFVFYTNPRGSDGRGEVFADITGKLGETDYGDLMEFVDEVLKRYPALDEKRLGICGGSYGGFMCNWVIGHTKRFAAAVSQRGISNFISKGLCTDIGFYHNFAQVADPWKDFKKIWETSPISSAFEAETPTLFIQSDEDYRCFMSGSIQMFSALKQHGTDAKMVLFHGENHELSRSGKPENRIRRLKEILAWLDQYLSSVPEEEGN